MLQYYPNQMTLNLSPLFGSVLAEPRDWLDDTWRYADTLHMLRVNAGIAEGLLILYNTRASAANPALFSSWILLFLRLL